MSHRMSHRYTAMGKQLGMSPRVSRCHASLPTVSMPPEIINLSDSDHDAPETVDSLLDQMKHKVGTGVCHQCKGPLKRGRGPVPAAIAKRSKLHCSFCSTSPCIGCDAVHCSAKEEVPNCVLGKLYTLSLLLPCFATAWSELVSKDQVSSSKQGPSVPTPLPTPDPGAAYLPSLSSWFSSFPHFDPYNRYGNNTNADPSELWGQVQKDDPTLPHLFRLTAQLLKGSHQGVEMWIQQSALIPLITKFLRNDSLENVSTKYKLYRRIFELLEVIAVEPHLSFLIHLDVERESNIVLLDDEGPSKRQKLGISIADLLEKLATQSKTFLQCKPLETEETKMAISMSQTICSLLTLTNASKSSISSVTRHETYESVLSPLQIQSKDIIGSPCIKYVYTTDIAAVVQTPGSKRTIKIMKELASLSTSLPLAPTASIFICMDDSRPDVIKALISGPPNTPYENGLFEFDFMFPMEYPSVPPKTQFLTTNGGQCRLNPNLYANGKVCLSLLGTWPGDPWIPNKSSLLQVLVSIQALILVELPFFNEPGFGEPRDNAESRKYNKTIRQYTLKHAILDVLKNPGGAFQDVILAFYRMKQDDVLKQLDAWVGLDVTLKPVANQIRKLLKTNGVKRG